jgi:hypothetical protein
MSMTPSTKRVSELREKGQIGPMQAKRISVAEKRFDLLNQAHESGSLEDKVNAMMKCMLSDARNELRAAQESLPYGMRRNLP